MLVQMSLDSSEKKNQTIVKACILTMWVWSDISLLDLHWLFFQYIIICTLKSCLMYSYYYCCTRVRGTASMDNIARIIRKTWSWVGNWLAMEHSTDTSFDSDDKSQVDTQEIWISGKTESGLEWCSPNFKGNAENWLITVDNHNFKRTCFCIHFSVYCFKQCNDCGQ